MWQAVIKRKTDARVIEEIVIEKWCAIDTTPRIVKFPFWRMTAENPQAVYACVNYGEATCPEEIANRSIVIDGDIGEVLSALLDEADCSDEL